LHIRQELNGDDHCPQNATANEQSADIPPDLRALRGERPEANSAHWRQGRTVRPFEDASHIDHCLYQIEANLLSRFKAALFEYNSITILTVEKFPSANHTSFNGGLRKSSLFEATVQPGDHGRRGRIAADGNVPKGRVHQKPGALPEDHCPFSLAGPEIMQDRKSDNR
jgi:hypothetical protein